ncbi:hypothetical protein ABFZ85_01880 [Hyphococcus formosus]|uniref:hypothetical protein n=1 Tax=Hyphococcus formosus TaxID=3143534 RepID=UPI00398B90CC
MTGNLLIDSIISLLAIGAMVLLAWAVFRAPVPALTVEEAKDRLSFDEPDFQVREWLVDENGRAVLALGECGGLVIISRLGLDLVTRRFAAGHLPRTAISDQTLTIYPADPGSRAVRVNAPEAGLWARRHFATARA